MSGSPKSRIYLSSPHMGTAELEFVQEAFATNWIAPLGPHVDAFEREFAAAVGSPHAAALSSGTAALHLALRLVGVQPDDEVFVSTLTFSASVNPILYEKARPVFIDADRTSWNMDPQLLAEALADRAERGRLPKAVVLVHLYGQSADIDAVQALCDRYDVALIEDAAEALGAVYYGAGARSLELGAGSADPASRKASDFAMATTDESQGKGVGGERVAGSNERGVGSPPPPSLPPSHEATARQVGAASGGQSSGFKPGVTPGTRGRMGIFSFNGNKIITTSGGGMLVSADQALIDKARFLATQARDPAPHYQHSEVGYNYRLSNVLAGIGRGQLRVLGDRVNARRANCARYQAAFADLPGVAFMPEADFGRCTRWLTCITVDASKAGVDREAVRRALEEDNVEARPVWKPMHLQPVFSGYDRFGGQVAEALFAEGLCLPSGSNLSPADLDRVISIVRRTLGG